MSELITIELNGSKASNVRTQSGDVLAELQRIDDALGTNFIDYTRYDRDTRILYFEAYPGDLSPNVYSHIEYDSPEMLALFFLLTTKMPFAAHHRLGAEFAWATWAQKKNPILEFSRGMGKSILIRVLVAYLMGVYPGGSSLLIRQASQPAQTEAERIAGIITDTASWQLFFPYLKPKIKHGKAGGSWSAQSGYSLVDTRLSKKDQGELEAGRTSPSLTKFGVGQSASIGTGVTLIAATDDIHSEENSHSPTQLESLITHFQAEIQPIVRPGARQIVIGTRWSDDDLLSILPDTGEWVKLTIPITVDGMYPDGEPTWPAMFPADEIDRLYAADLKPGKSDFSRNRLLQIVLDIDTHFTYLDTPNDEINKWFEQSEKRIGVDYASASQNPIGAINRSHTAMITIARNPNNMRWVVTEVLVQQYTQSQAETQLKALFARNLPCPAVVIEESGTGIELVALMQRHKGMPIVGLKQSGHGSKETRWERDLQPIFANGYVTISDDKTPGLDALRHALARYPNFKSRGDAGADLLDALWIALYYPMIHSMDPYAARPKKKNDGPSWWEMLAQM